MSRRFSWSVLALLVLSLFVGTQMPNAWRNGVIHSLHAPSVLSSWAHFVLFAAMALVLQLRPLAWSFGRVLSEGGQP